MEAHTMLPLCFNKEDFMMEQFSVDQFVSEYRKYASLETIREDLTLLHRKLCTAMLEMINNDYADVVNLSSNLVGLDKSIKNLTIPLQSFRNHVEQIKNNQHEILKVAFDMLNERTLNQASKVLMHHVSTVFEGLEKIKKLSNNNTLEVLERMAFALHTVQFHMMKIIESDSHIAKDFAVNNEAVKEISKSIETQLESVFLESLEKSNVENLEKVLRIFAVISSEAKLEYCFRCKVVRPFMKNIITQSKISKGLANVYNSILSFIPKCNDILKITCSSNFQHASEKTEAQNIPGYDFLVNAVWPEIISCFQYISQAYIYAIGDPVLFLENYSASMDFLHKFEHQLQVQSSVKRFRKHPSYIDFISKWNLNIYFEIRFGEIAAKLEEQLHTQEFFVKSDGTSPYMLSATQSLYSCLELCLNCHVPPLKSSFIKLFFQLLSRFKKAADSNLLTVEESVPVAMLIKDVEFLVSEINLIFVETISEKWSHEFVKDCLTIAFDEAMENLKEIPQFSGELIVKLLTAKCCVHLKMISNIPQRYRKTNRDIPSVPSPYVSEVLSPLTMFSMESDFLSLQWKNYCVQETIERIMKRCITLIRDVLTSIKKMEDSLKILKKRAKPMGQFTSGTITDDDKIRRQLAIDVSYFEELILKSDLLANTSNLETLKELKELVKSAERINS